MHREVFPPFCNHTLLAFTLLKPDGEHFLQHLLRNHFDLLSREIAPLTRTHRAPPPHAEDSVQALGFQGHSRGGEGGETWFPRALRPTVAVKANQRLTYCMQVDSYLLLNAPRAGGA